VTFCLEHIGTKGGFLDCKEKGNKSSILLHLSVTRNTIEKVYDESIEKNGRCDKATITRSCRREADAGNDAK